MMLKSSFLIAAIALAGSFAQADDVLDVTALSNQVRGQQGLGSVVPDQTLNAIADRFAADMQTRNYFSHTSPDGNTMVARLRAGGAPFAAAGENIAWGQKSPSAVMTAWMNSPGHRRNIMNGKYHRMGVGHVGTYWVMVLTD